MQRGPKPTPSGLRLLQGGPDARGLNPNEPIPPASDMPEPPDYLTPVALEEWNRLAEDLYGMGVLTSIDATMMAAYCMAYARWRKAEEDLETCIEFAKADPKDNTMGGALMETTNGNLVQNPLIGIANTARKDMARLAVEFGLSPSSRTLIDAGKRGETDPVAARYFGRRG